MTSILTRKDIREINSPWCVYKDVRGKLKRETKNDKFATRKY